MIEKKDNKGGFVEEWDVHDLVWFKGNYKNGERDGPCEEFDTIDELISKGNYKNGKKDGLWETFRVEGLNKTVEYPFVDLDEGILVSKGNYKNGKPDGLWENFHENGQTTSEKNYWTIRLDPWSFGYRVLNLKAYTDIES